MSSTGRTRNKLVFYQDAAGEYRWRLQAENGETIADSGEGYVSLRNAMKGYEAVKQAVAEID